MARPKAKELTERELEIMHVFWSGGREATAAEVRDALAERGRELAYTTVATLVRILTEKGFLELVHQERPFRYRAAQSYEEVSSRMLGDMIDRVFSGSRELLLKRLVEQKDLTSQERTVLEDLLRESQ